MMKKCPQFILFLVLIMFLPACHENSPSASPQSTYIPTTTPTTSEEVFNETPLDEPPLSNADLAIAVPEFLTSEQQELYRRAYSLYEHLLGDSIEYAETLDEPLGNYETVTVGDNTYLVSQGRYADWSYFDAVIHSVFTDAFWEKRNDANSGYSLHIEHNGKHCFLDTSIGMGYYYNENFPDEFRLDKQTDQSIEFTLIGHYSPVWPRNGENPEQRDERRSREYDYTLEFPIRMVLTDSGWRFDEFHTSLVDEDELEYEYAEDEDGTVTITKYIGYGGDVIIPAELDGKKVTAIGNTFAEEGAFQNCTAITSVVISDGVTEIQDNAFQSCANLTTVTIPTSVKLLRNCAFDDCPNLQAVYFEGDAPEIANYVFSSEGLTFFYHEGTFGWTNPWYGAPTEVY